MSQIPKKIRAGVLERDGHACRRCGITILGRAYSLHHRQGRHGEEAHRYSNLLTLCGTGSSGCHFEVHAHPEASYELGLMVRRLGYDDPEEIPVVDLNGDAVCLTDDGDVIPIYNQGGTAA